jgi:hypothetical protein
MKYKALVIIELLDLFETNVEKNRTIEHRITVLLKIDMFLNLFINSNMFIPFKTRAVVQFQLQNTR